MIRNAVERDNRQQAPGRYLLLFTAVLLWATAAGAGAATAGMQAAAAATPGPVAAIEATIRERLNEIGRFINQERLEEARSGLADILATLPPDAPAELRASVHVHQATVHFLRAEKAGLAEHTELALALTEGTAGPDRADALTMKVLVVGGAGQAEATLPWLEQELTIRRQLPVAESKLDSVLTNLAITYAELGNLRLAEALLLEAKAFADQYRADSHMPALIRTNLAFVYGNRKEYARAAAQYLETVEQARLRQPDSLILANRLTNLGDLWLSMGLLAEAADVLEESRSLLEKHAPRSMVMVRTLVALGRIAAGSGDHVHSISLTRTAAELAESIAPASIYSIVAARALGRALLLREAVPAADIDSARMVLAEAERLSQSLLPGSGERAHVLYLLGLASRLQQDHNSAEAWLRQAIAVLDIQYTLLGDNLIAAASFSQAFEEVYKSLAELLVEDGRLTDAVDVLEAFRARQLQDRLGLNELLESSTAGRDYLSARQALRTQAGTLIDALQSANGQGDNLKDPVTLQRQLSELSRAENRLRQQTIASEPRLAALISGASGDAARLTRRLADDDRLLYFALGEQRSFALGFRPGAAPQLHWLPGRALLREQVDQLRTLGQQPQAAISSYQAIAADLYDQLIRPFQDLLGDAGTLYLVPDAELYLLPFAGLFDQRRSTYLLEQHALTVLNRLDGLDDPAPPVPPPADRQFVGLAYSGPGPDSAERADTRAGGRSLPLLPGVDQEVRGAARRFDPRARTFTGASATEQAARAAGAADIVHFAAHAVVNAEEPLRSYIALAPSGADDGRLELREVLENLRLDQALVVLSACDSAIGPIYAGEGMIGLARGFAYAGARQVLATLWPVSDQSSATIMSRFYQSLTAGQSTAAALRDAQLALLRGESSGGLKRLWERWFATPDVDRTHPYYWSAFTVHGAP